MNDFTKITTQSKGGSQPQDIGLAVAIMAVGPLGWLPLPSWHNAANPLYSLNQVSASPATFASGLTSGSFLPGVTTWIKPLRNC